MWKSANYSLQISDLTWKSGLFSSIIHHLRENHLFSLHQSLIEPINQAFSFWKSPMEEKITLLLFAHFRFKPKTRLFLFKNPPFTQKSPFSLRKFWIYPINQVFSFWKSPIYVKISHFLCANPRSNPNIRPLLFENPPFMRKSPFFSMPILDLTWKSGLFENPPFSWKSPFVSWQIRDLNP